MEIYDKKLFDKKQCPQTIASVLFTLYRLKLIWICLVMRNLNTLKNLKHN